MQYACDMEKTMTESIPEDVKMRIVNGYNRERSGEMCIRDRIWSETAS